MRRSIPFFFLFFLLSSLALWGCGNVCRHERLADVVVPPSCDQGGYTLHLCQDCSLQYSSDFLPPTGHTLTATVHEPTCEEEGYTHFSCPCGYEYDGDLVPPKRHQLTERQILPTCLEGGYTQVHCRSCSLTYQKDLVPPLGHRFSEEVIAPTCKERGYTLQRCSSCPFEQRVQYTDSLGHRYQSAVTTYPTFWQDGEMELLCSCGAEQRISLTYREVFHGAAVTETQGVLAKGVDVSKWQHRTGADGGYLPLDWSAIRKAGFDFAILKAGSTPKDGSDGMDPVFEMNYRDAKAAGLKLGAYFYTYATTLEALRADAQRLIGWLRDKELEYPIYLDLEDSSLAALGKDVLTEFCHVFLSTLQEAGYYGALYSNQNWLTEYLHQEELRDRYDLWYARYPTTSSAPVSTSATQLWNPTLYGSQLGLWQYTPFGVIDGFDGVCFDFNYAYRDYPALIKAYGYNGFSPSLSVTDDIK